MSNVGSPAPSLDAALAGALEIGSGLGTPLPDLTATPPSRAERDARLAGLLSTHFRTVWRALRRFGVPQEWVDDAAQEVFLVVARRWREIETDREKQFLYGVALRVAANARRARAARPEFASSDRLELESDPAPNPETLLTQKRARELLDNVLGSLPEDLRVAFVLFELEGCSGPEVAALLEIPLGTATSRLRRAREAFQTAAARTRQRLGRGPQP